MRLKQTTLAKRVEGMKYPTRELGSLTESRKQDPRQRLVQDNVLVASLFYGQIYYHIIIPQLFM